LCKLIRRRCSLPESIRAGWSSTSIYFTNSSLPCLGNPRMCSRYRQSSCILSLDLLFGSISPVAASTTLSVPLHPLISCVAFPFTFSGCVRLLRG